MSSSKEFKNHVLEQLGGAQITARSMMGGYCIYAEGKLVGGIYEDRFMLKQTEALKTFVRDYKLEYPYKGSKQLMILIENIDNTPFMRELANHICGCVKNTMSICGTDCSACGFYKSACQGCNQCEGSVFYMKGGQCPIYHCCAEENSRQSCASCEKVPCDIWMRHRDPSYSDEEFQKNIEGRLSNLRKG